MSRKDHEKKRHRMVEHQIRRRGIRDERVLAAMERIPRHRFVPEKLVDYAYDDSPLSIGDGQTISQPYMVALMTETVAPAPGDRILEVGTGSGYQTAILAELVREVYSIERIPALAERAERILSKLGIENVSIRIGDGSEGLTGEAPFDGILVTAGAPEVPDPLVEQLCVGGRLVIPIGGAHHQTLCRISKGEEGIQKMSGTGCVFVPLIGKYGWGGNPSERYP